MHRFHAPQKQALSDRELTGGLVLEYEWNGVWSRSDWERIMHPHATACFHVIVAHKQKIHYLSSDLKRIVLAHWQHLAYIFIWAVALLRVLLIMFAQRSTELIRLWAVALFTALLPAMQPSPTSVTECPLSPSATWSHLVLETVPAKLLFCNTSVIRRVTRACQC